jgi:hypothetical protein
VAATEEQGRDQGDASASATPAASKSGDDKSFGALANELVGLVVGYAKQETVDPLKALGRFVAFGVAGAICLAIGGALLALAAVRAVQFEASPHLSGNLSWLPYVAGVLVAGGAAGLAASRIAKTPKKVSR